MFWVLMMAIPIDAPHPDAAAKWIDHILDPAVIAGISNAIYYANANDASKPLLDPAIVGDPMIYPPNDVMQRLVPEGTKPLKFVRMRNRAWAQVKAGG
jgi:putrescine transport system substrate-binding protein